MPHITEGEIHAYLDGALSAIDPDAERRLAAHLARCADCRARLERERGIHDRSTELLAAALPESAEIPPFASVGESGSAKRRDRTGEGGGRGRLAWAASIAVALGAGWIGHAILGGSGDRIPDARLAPAATREARSRAVDDTETTVENVADADAANETVEAPSGRAQTAPEALRDEVAAEPAPAGARQETAATETGILGRAREEEGAERERAAERSEAAEAAPATPEAPRAAAGDAPAASVPTVVDAGEDVEALGKTFAGATWRAVPPEEAMQWVGRPLLGVPELAVVEVLVAEVDGLRLARVRQAFPDGTPLEVVLERPEAAPADRAGAGPARVAPSTLRMDELEQVGRETETGLWRRLGLEGRGEAAAPVEGVRARVDGAWVTLAAPVASDSLRAVVSHVRRLETP